MMDRVRISTLLGKKVVTKDGVELGDVIDLELDPAGWRVRWIYVRLHRALIDRFHIDAPFVMGTKAISFSPAQLENVDRHVSLLATLAEIIPASVVSFETDATNHLGGGV